ncbi:MAG: type VI secretion system tip protein TssI/VgrG [Myxococcota bacterium]
MRGDVPHDTPFRLVLAGGEVNCPVVAFEGEDALNTTPRYDVTVSAERGAYAPSFWLGHLVHLELGRPELRRHGLVVACGRVDNASRGRELVRCTVQPRVWRLSKRRQSRVFQDQTAVDIITTLLREHQVPYALRLSQRHPALEYRVQYRESDLALVDRLAGDHGLFWFVTDVGGEDVLVLGDAPTAYDDGLDPKRLRRHQEGALRDAAPAYRRFSWRHALEPTEFHLRHHDLDRSGRGIDGIAHFEPGGSIKTTVAQQTWREDAAVPNQAMFAYDHGQNHGLDHDAEQRVRVLGEQARRNVVSGHGQSFDPRLSAGTAFELDEHEIDHPLVVTSIRHAYRWSGDTDETAHHAFTNDVVAVPAETTYRAPPSPRREAPSMELATVVAPEGPSALHTDELGRVRVSFHWNRQGADATNSCWLRVVQPWAGPGWGSVFVPRCGMEVAVGFAGGDIDRPLVLGALYNGQNRPPFDPRGLKSGIRSQGLDSHEPTGAQHELSFDDTAHAERVTLKSHGALDEIATGDGHRRIGGREQHVVGDAYDLLVSGATHLRSGDTFTLATAKDSHTTVGGNAHRRHEGGLLEETGGATYLKAEQGFDVRTPRRLRLSCQDFSLHAGDPGSPDERDLLIDVIGRGTFTSTGSIFIGAQQRVELACGQTSLTLLPDRIRLSAPTVEIEGKKSTTLTGDGASVALAGTAQISAGEILLGSSSASLVLDANASLDGTLVLLNCAGGEAGGGILPADTGPTQTLRLTMLAAGGQPFAHWRFRLSSAGTVHTGRLDAAGALAVEVPEGATQARLTLTTDGIATTHQFNIRLGPLPPLHTIQGIKTRLSNLGYYPHPSKDDQVDERLRTAVRLFQISNGLPPLGHEQDHESDLTLDKTTLDALEAARKTNQQK